MAKPYEEILEMRRQATLAAKKRTRVEQKFYTAIGRALTAWGRVEDALCHVFCHAISKDRWTYTEKAYWAVASFDARLKMTDRLVKSRREGKKAALAKWGSVYDDVFAHNLIRNKIAHGSVLQFPYSNRKHPKQEIDVFFAPYFWSRSREHFRKVQPTKDGFLDGRPKERLYIPNLVQYETDFDALKDSLMAVAAEIRDEV